MTWTPEREAQLREWWAEQVHSYEIAERLGVTPKAVRGKANRLGLRFEKMAYVRRKPLPPRGSHRPADDRSAELLREAGRAWA